MIKITKAQQRALLEVYNRRPGQLGSYLAFRRTARVHYGDCVMVPWAGMILGIETDGYTHS